MVALHKNASLLNHLGAIHTQKLHKVFASLGGFKLMYPVFSKTLDSNLNYEQVSDILCLLFKILKALMNVDYQHINSLYQNKFLIEILKLFIFEAGDRDVIRANLLENIMFIIQDI